MRAQALLNCDVKYSFFLTKEIDTFSLTFFAPNTLTEISLSFSLIFLSFVILLYTLKLVLFLLG